MCVEKFSTLKAPSIFQWRIENKIKDHIWQFLVESFHVGLEGPSSSVKEFVFVEVSGKSIAKSKSLSKSTVSFEFGTGQPLGNLNP